jgi:hypothetical protein
MAKNQSPLQQWEAMGVNIEKIIVALDMVKSSGNTPNGFSYFTPVIQKLLSPHQEIKEEFYARNTRKQTTRDVARSIKKEFGLD